MEFPEMTEEVPTSLEQIIPSQNILYSKEQRAGFYKCWVVFQRMASAYPQFPLDTLPVIAAVSLAYHAGYRPNVSQIANILNIPRTTVLYRLRKLELSGYVVLDYDWEEKATKVVVTQEGAQAWAVLMNRIYLDFEGGCPGSSQGAPSGAPSGEPPGTQAQEAA